MTAGDRSNLLKLDDLLAYWQGGSQQVEAESVPKLSMTHLPKSKSGQLADLMREQLASGAWGDRLPSERALAKEFLVSRTTLRLALATLTKEGQIEPPSSTRGAREIRTAGKGSHVETITKFVF